MIIKQLLPVQRSFSVSHDDFAEAVMDFMEHNLGDCIRTRLDSETGYFAIFVQVDHNGDQIGEEFVGRFFTSGIGKRGGVKPPIHKFYRNSLEEIEKELGCSSGFLSDSDSDWDGSETIEEAWERKSK